MAIYVKKTDNQDISIGAIKLVDSKTNKLKDINAVFWKNMMKSMEAVFWIPCVSLQKIRVPEKKQQILYFCIGIH